MDAAQLSREIQATHHALLREQLPRVSEALRTGGSARLSGLWGALDDLLIDHLAKEENVLFPAIQTLVETGLVEGGSGSALRLQPRPV